MQGCDYDEQQDLETKKHSGNAVIRRNRKSTGQFQL
jgi:hypothetical protein